MLNKYLYILFYLFVGGLLTACGQKGPLFLENKPPVLKKESTQPKAEAKKLTEKDNQR